MKTKHFFLACCILLCSYSEAYPQVDRDEQSKRNKQIITSAFEHWKNGTGNFFDLLADDVEWTVAGSGMLSGIYKGKAHFIQRAVLPINNRLATKITPQLITLTAEGSTVWIHWSGSATTKSGGGYKNEYAWKLELQNGKIIKAVAFLDTKKLEELLTNKTN